jgi:6-pyruvoyl-tetrahydropterin synthase
MITIRGPKNGVEDAKKRIQQIVDELVKKFDHKIIIPVSHKKKHYISCNLICRIHKLKFKLMFLQNIIGIS